MSDNGLFWRDADVARLSSSEADRFGSLEGLDIPAHSDCDTLLDPN